MESRARTLEADALNEVETSATYDKYSDKALGSMKEARKYRNCLDVLEEISKSDNHTIVDLK